uniref:Cation/H+ exchanger transmembrane domain-containing protein n=1 Tax=Cucumis melo TaxID=3656 RepID=A0A9I9E5Y2_CUCME
MELHRDNLYSIAGEGIFGTLRTWGNLNSVVHIINALTLTCFGSDVVLKQDETPLLYSLVFGGGLVNDASSVVLFNAIKKLDLSHYFNRCHSVSSWAAMCIYHKEAILRELLFLSGILSVFFCGVVMSHYTSWNNGNGSSKLIPRHAFATLSFVAEIFIFLCVGMDALDIEKWNVFAIWWAGLMRGAASVALAYHQTPKFGLDEN